MLIQDESDDFVMSYCLEVSIRFQRQSPLFVRFPVLIEQRDQDNKRAFLTRTVSTPVSGAKAVNSVPFRPRQRSMPNPDVSLDVLSQLEVEINQVVEKYDKEQQLALLWVRRAAGTKQSRSHGVLSVDVSRNGSVRKMVQHSFGNGPTRAG